MDNYGMPVKGVAVILQSIDSLLIDVATTDSLGIYNFNNRIPERYRLMLQHLSYNAFIREYSDTNIPDIVLEERDYNLSEVEVKANYPLVKVERNKLIYDATNLNKSIISTNAYDFIKSFPSIMENNGSIELIGASKLKIIIDDNPSSLDNEQTVDLLKSIPVSRVKQVEIMYNSPAKYNFHGAVINVILNNEQKYYSQFRGEAGTEYSQSHYALGDIYLNLNYSNKNLVSNLLLNCSKGRIYGGEDMNAVHTLSDKVVDIIQYNVRKEKLDDFSLRGDISYNFSNKDKISTSYYHKNNDNNSHRNGKTEFIYKDRQVNISQASNKTNSALNNVRIQFDSHYDFQIWADYTLYNSPSELRFENCIVDDDKYIYENTVTQEVNKFTMGGNQDLSLNKKWEMNYGLLFSYEKYKDYIAYNYSINESLDDSSIKTQNDKQREISGSIYADLYGKITEKIDFNIGAVGEYFNSNFYSDNKETTLWNKFMIHPSMSINYKCESSNFFQLNVTSDKSFPYFWEMSNQVSPLNAYSYAYGNPKLLPSQDYNGQIGYYLKGKYIFLAYCNYEHNKFVQMPYQSSESLSTTFITENLDFGLKYGLSFILKENLFSFWHLQSTLQGFNNRNKKSNFFDIDIDNSGWVGAVILNNTFTIPNHENLQLNVKGVYVTKGMVQGLYKLGNSFNLSSSIRYKFINEKLELVFRVNDILDKAMPIAKVKQGTQNSYLKKINENRYFLISLNWNFNGYKKDMYKEIDTSRYGK
ncbi:MAG: outer membrane beta-barrel protein [Bacteroidales bacterium]|nr:outer membrane beta-barrel protein [Bacteroidales bacterium]